MSKRLLGAPASDGRTQEEGKNKSIIENDDDETIDEKTLWGKLKKKWKEKKKKQRILHVRV